MNDSTWRSPIAPLNDVVVDRAAFTAYAFVDNACEVRLGKVRVAEQPV